MSEISVLMVGPSRSGKTSILASMLNVNDTGNDVFTKYKLKIEKGNSSAENINLEQSRIQLTSLSEYDKNKLFLGALRGTQERHEYQLALKFADADKTKIEFNFIDVPGEWFSEHKGNDGADEEMFEKLLDQARDCQVLMIAVDVPALMEADRYNEDGETKKFLIAEYTCQKALESINPVFGNNIGEKAPRLVVFVPIKCERLIKEGKTKDIYELIKRLYHGRLDAFGTIEGNKQDNLKILFMPIQTIGNVYDCKPDYSPELLIYDPETYNIDKKPIRRLVLNKTRSLYEEFKKYKEFASLGEVFVARCHRNTNGSIRLFNGDIIEKEDIGIGDRIESTGIMKHYPFAIPSSIGGSMPLPYIWYKADKTKGYSPDNNDQLLMEIMKFAIQDIAYKSGKSVKELLNSKPGIITRILIALGLKTPFNPNQLNNLVIALKKMIDGNEFKKNYFEYFNSFDYEGSRMEV